MLDGIDHACVVDLHVRALPTKVPLLDGNTGTVHVCVWTPFTLRHSRLSTNQRRARALLPKPDLLQWLDLRPGTGTGQQGHLPLRMMWPLSMSGDRTTCGVPTRVAATATLRQIGRQPTIRLQARARRKTKDRKKTYFRKYNGERRPGRTLGAARDDTTCVPARPHACCKSRACAAAHRFHHAGKEEKVVDDADPTFHVVKGLAGEGAPAAAADPVG